MLNEKAIYSLLQPIIDRQESINVFVLTFIANKIKRVGELSKRDSKKLSSLFNFGADAILINEELARLSNLQVRDIKGMIKTVAKDNYLDMKPFYDYRHRSYIPFEKNKDLQKVTNAIARQTVGTYKNLSNSKATGFLIRDLKNPTKLKFQTIGDAYKSVMDEAIQSVQSGSVSYDVAMNRTLKQLLDSGVRRMYWDSGYTQRLDTAVRRNLYDGVRAIQQAIEDEAGKQFGADGKELSVHENSAPDHEPFQGHIFTNKEWENLQSSKDFTDVDGEHFTGVERVIGMWNCRHFAYSIIIGIKPPRYTKEQLQSFINRNKKGFEINGKHLTCYECTQMQRELETKIRYAKEHQMTYYSAGNKDVAKVYRKKVIDLTEQYKVFSKSCKLSAQMNRAKVTGYHAINL